ncbi:MAG: VTT domain-containing protein [Patescibacteria group bacterium]
MAWFKDRYIKHHKLKLAIYFWAFAFLVWLVLYFGTTLSAVFASPEDVRAWVLSYGRAAPLVLFLLQVLQVIIAPLNNFLINVAGGYIFGPWAGFVYNYTGWVIGALIVFLFTRKFGRGFVNLFIKEEKLAQYDALLAKGTYLVFFLFLVPGPPDDLLVYLVGLSRSISAKTFLWMILIGKIPGKLATSFLGAGVAEHSMVSLALYGVFIVVSLVIFWLKPELWSMGKQKHLSK